MAIENELPTMMTPAQARYQRTGLGITWKIFLPTAAVIVLAIGGAIGWSSLRVRKLIEQSTRESFSSTQFVFENLQASRYDRLKRMNALVAQDVTFKALVLETDEATQKEDLPLRRDL